LQIRKNGGKNFDMEDLLDMLREQKNVGNFYGGKCKEFGLEFQNIFE